MPGIDLILRLVIQLLETIDDSRSLDSQKLIHTLIRSILFYTLHEILKSGKPVPPILFSILQTGESFKYLRLQNFVHISQTEIVLLKSIYGLC